jgi:hypothetical protein
MLWVVGFLLQDRTGCLPLHFLSINAIDNLARHLRTIFPSAT